MLSHHSISFSRYYFVLFLLHRSLFIFSVFWLEGSPYLQLSLTFLVTLAMLVYLSLVKPFKEKSDNLLNILYTLFLLLLYLLGFILASPLNSSYSFSFGLCILLGIFAINLANLV